MMGSSKSAFAAGWDDRPGPGGDASQRSDGTNALLPGRSPTPTGLETWTDPHTLIRQRTRLHVELLREAAAHPGESVDPFSVAETFRYYILDRNIAGSIQKSPRQTEYIHKYKAFFVHAKRDPIKQAAARFGLPAVLVAGTIYNEVGGSDLIKPFVYWARDCLPGMEEPDRTSLGVASLQPRRALSALGYDPAHVDPSIRNDVVQSLIHDPAFSIFVCAAHLAELRDRFFSGHGPDDLNNDALATLGSRYNFGPQASDESIRRDPSYGLRIVDRLDILARLLSDSPVAEPDWSEPLKNGLGKMWNSLP